MSISVTNITFDTLAYAKKLKLVGFTEEQAEVQAETLASIIEDKLATKRDIKELELALKNNQELLKRDLKIWFGSMLVIGITVLAALITFIPILHQ